MHGGRAAYDARAERLQGRQPGMSRVHPREQSGQGLALAPGHVRQRSVEVRLILWTNVLVVAIVRFAEHVQQVVARGRVAQPGLPPSGSCSVTSVKLSLGSMR